jgi:hypothetical protein
MFFCNAALAAAPAVTWTPLALTNDAAPGVAGGEFLSFDLPSINTHGDVAFAATLKTGGGVTLSNDRGLWGPGTAAGSLMLLGREGFAAADAGGTFIDFQAPLLNDAGGVAVQATAMISTFTRHGIWGPAPGGGGALQLVARSGSGLPDGSGATFVGFNELHLNNNGQTAFAFDYRDVGEPITAPPHEGLWGPGAGGDGAVIVRQDGAVPGHPGATFHGAGYPNLLPDGSTVLRTTLSGGAFGSTKDALVRYEAQQVQVLALAGQTAPGSGGGQFQNFLFPRANAAGQVVFYGDLTDGRIGIWSSQPDGALTAHAVEGAPAPGIPGEATIATVGFPIINAAGDVAFAASLQQGGAVTADNDTCLFVPDGAGGVRAILREGFDAPDVGGADIASFGFFSMNTVGDLLIPASLQLEGAVGSSNNEGIWFYDAGRDLLALLAREGQTFEVAPGDVRVISTLSATGLAGGEEGRWRSLNDVGQVALRLGFTDGTQGVLVATVPEPMAATPLLLIAAAWGWRRKRCP